MENIKFRGYVKFLREMHEVREMIFDKGTVMIDAYQYGLDRDDAPVMQFTGFQDSKGQDIYEGDIVYIAGFGNGVASLCHANGTEFTDCNGDYRAARYAAAENDIGEILGNIYQHPELLEQKQ